MRSRMRFIGGLGLVVLTMQALAAGSPAMAHFGPTSEIFNSPLSMRMVTAFSATSASSVTAVTVVG